MSRIRRLLRWAFLLSLVGLVIGGGAFGLLYISVSSKLPDVQTLRTIELQEPLYVYARDGRLIGLFGETRRYPVEIEKVPKRLKDAFIAIEDARFYEHGGVDYKGVARAIWLMATTDGKRVPGGSTITQQVARQYFLSSEYKLKRKFAEMLLARKMEAELGKDEIFELYLNKSFFGNRAYGVGAAAEFYYGKPLDQLSLDEMASLAAIPKFPSSGNPLNNPARAKIRRDYVLTRMQDDHGRRSAGRAGGGDARQPARAPDRSLGAVHRRNGAPGNDRPLRRGSADQGLPRHHHHRPGAAGRGRQVGARRSGQLRPPPRLEY
jgi:penicillin-binding protein 1A